MKVYFLDGNSLLFPHLVEEAKECQASLLEKNH